MMDFDVYRRPRNENKTFSLVRVGDSAFTYKQIADRLGITVTQAHRKVRGVRRRKAGGAAVTWESLGMGDK